MPFVIFFFQEAVWVGDCGEQAAWGSHQAGMVALGGLCGGQP